MLSAMSHDVDCAESRGQHIRTVKVLYRQPSRPRLPDSEGHMSLESCYDRGHKTNDLRRD